MLTFHIDARETLQINVHLQKTVPVCSHLTVQESMCIHIFDFLTYNGRLGIKLARFPYRETCLNKWFDVANEGHEEESNIHIINMDKIGREKKAYSLQYDVEFPNGLQDADHKILFHGTDHKSAQSIHVEGIILEKGKTNRDFSNGKGFYLNSSFEEALKWACYRSQCPAVVVFKVSLATLDGFEGMDLQPDGENYEDWDEIVHQFRLLNKPDKKFLKRIKRFTYIEGPMASFSKKMSQSGSKHLSRLQDSYQFCILSDDLAYEFDRSLHSLLFYAKK